MKIMETRLTDLKRNYFVRNGRFAVTKRTSDDSLVQKYQFNFVVKNASIHYKGILWIICASNQLFCVHNSCHNNENNMSDTKPGCPILKVHMWDIMFSREEYLRSYWKSGVPMAKHPDRTHLRVFKSSVKSVNQKQKMRKFVFQSSPLFL